MFSARSESDGSEDDEFFDAVDHFDQEIVDLITETMQKQADEQKEKNQPKVPKLAAIGEADKEEENEDEDGSVIAKSDKNQGSSEKIAICASLNIGKLRFQVLEASDVREELVRNLKERL